MYNWATAKSGSVCPANWYVPTLAEWNSLASTIGTSTAGGALSANSSLWTAGSNSKTDIYGFSVLPSGRCHSTSNCMSLGELSMHWSATAGCVGAGQTSWFVYNSSAFTTACHGANYDYQFSIRCARQL
jgi:uncharacterized protein (TIGR02145 family)